MGPIRLCVFGASPGLGGTEKYLRTLYSALDKERVQFDFLLSHNTGPLPYEQEILSQGGQVCREYYMLREKHEPGYLTARQLFDRHPEWDGAYVNLQSINTSYRLLVEAARRRLPWRLIHAHNSGIDKKLTIKQKLYEQYFHLTKRETVTGFLACSALAGRFVFHNTESVIIPNAVDFEKFARSPARREEMRGRYHIGPDETVMGFCGGLRPQKNPELVVGIFAELCRLVPAARLVMVGKGPREAACRALAAERGVLEKTVFAGEVENVQDYMQMMDCLVLPSRYEGFGIVLLEAQAAGLPCFTTKGAVPQETNVTGRVTFLPAQSTAGDWAAAIRAEGFAWEDRMDALRNSAYTVAAMRDRFMSVLDAPPRPQRRPADQKPVQGGGNPI